MEQICVNMSRVTEVVRHFLDLEASGERDEKIRACSAGLRLGVSVVSEAAE